MTQDEHEYELEQLLATARAAREKAYAPYSHYKVGAALRAASGKIYTGCNIENASYGATICAERVAACSAIAAGEKEFLTLAVVTDGPTPGPPCGMCRQFLAEFAPELPIILGNLQGDVVKGNLRDYLPQAFRGQFLGGNNEL